MISVCVSKYMAEGFSQKTKQTMKHGKNKRKCDKMTAEISAFI